MNMKRLTAIYIRRGIAVALTCYMATVGLAEQTFDMGAPAGGCYPVKRRVRYGYVVKNSSNTAAEAVPVWISAPVRQTSTQWCQRLKISRDAVLVVDEDGNQAFKVMLDRVAPLGRTTITIEADLCLDGVPQAHGSDATNAAYLSPQRFIESDAPPIVERARRFGGNDADSTAKRIFDWVGGHVQPTTRFRSTRGASYALEHAEGDCSEYAFLFTALCRARAIPSRCITGYVCQRDAVLRPTMLHSWSEFHDGSVWVLADCQLKAFAPEIPRYVAMRVTAASARIPLAPHQLTMISGSNLTVRMKR